MADNKQQFPSVKVMTVRGRAIYPKLDKPDTKFVAEGQYSVKLSIPADSLGERDAIVAMLETYVAEKRAALAKGDGKQKAKAKTLSVREFLTDANEVDDEGNETGNIILNFKMKAAGVSKKDGKPWTRKPSVFDAKGKKLNPCPPVWGGSILKVAGKAEPYYNAKDNECGITLRLEGVQIIDLKTGGGRDAADFGFHEEDGFAAEDSGGFEDETSGGTEGGAAGADDEEF
jgi:hypothetical protein